jgi:hypothetical protein
MSFTVSFAFTDKFLRHVHLSQGSTSAQHPATHLRLVATGPFLVCSLAFGWKLSVSERFLLLLTPDIGNIWLKELMQAWCNNPCIVSQIMPIVNGGAQKGSNSLALVGGDILTMALIFVACGALLGKCASVLFLFFPEGGTCFGIHSSHGTHLSIRASIAFAIRR